MKEKSVTEHMKTKISQDQKVKVKLRVQIETKLHLTKITNRNQSMEITNIMDSLLQRKITKKSLVQEEMQ